MFTEGLSLPSSNRIAAKYWLEQFLDIVTVFIFLSIGLWIIAVTSPIFGNCEFSPCTLPSLRDALAFAYRHWSGYCRRVSPAIHEAVRWAALPT